MSIDFKLEWYPAPGVAASAEAACWARMEIRLNDTITSELLDTRDNASRAGFFGSTLPLVEWLVEAWPRLIHERRVPPPGAVEEPEWRGFHSFRAGRQGGAFPDLRVRRINDREFELTTVPDLGRLAPGISVRFLNTYKARHPSQEVERELARIIEATLSRLDDQPSNERIASLRQRWKSLSVSDFAAAAARLGVDVDSLEEHERELIASLMEHPNRRALWALAEGSSAPSIQERLNEALILWNHLPQTPPVSASWREAQKRVTRLQREAPWHTGWSAAERFRESLGISEDESTGRKLPRMLAARLGWPVEAQILPADQLVQGVDTVHVQPRSHMPTVLTTVAQKHHRNFRLARSLYHFLFTAEPGTDAIFADSPLLPGELSEANAFAAELLAPAKVLHGLAPPSGVWSRKDRYQVARALEVSPMVIEHQIENRQIGALV